MPLFLVLAGAAVWHSLGRRGPRAFARERVARLLVPFVAGVLLLVPPTARLRSSSHEPRADRRWGQWAREGVLPVYMLHQTVAVVLAAGSSRGRSRPAFNGSS